VIDDDPFPAFLQRFKNRGKCERKHPRRISKGFYRYAIRPFVRTVVAVLGAGERTFMTCRFRFFCWGPA
jgi:hypothetical protein